ncbi:MAG TPA: amidohydrolase family protein [Acidimicrobiales bacterium]|nr:amidohydrolase family protein [Acidimicrobiales bacterium]
MTPEGELPKIVSADDHVVEPANVWQDRLPARYREVGPRIVRAPAEMSFFGGKFTYRMGGDGPLADWWLYEDLQWPHTRLGACAGFPPEEVKVAPITYDEMRPGCFRQQERLEDMDLNWVEASLCFPTFPRFCGQTFLEAKDKDLALLCVQAYNDWMVEEWCGGSGGRLVPLCLIPLWDAQLAAAEVRRNAGRGVRAVCFSEQPPHLGLPSVHDKDRFWEPFVAACAETGTVICMHSGSGSKMPSTSPDAPPAVGSTLTHELAEQSLADWLFSGLLVRHPDLVITYSEGQIGWVPYILTRADRIWEHNRGWNEVRDLVPEPPSTYYWGRVFGCFFEDPAGLAQLDAIGPDQVTFEVDYPHADGTWPHTREVAEKMFAGLDAVTVRKLTRDNTIRMLGLELA